MTRVAIPALVLAVMTGIAGIRVGAADDPLSRARLLYNQGQFEAAVNAAELARLAPGRVDSADLVAARAYLERFRVSAASDDLTNARERLRRLDPQRLAPRERTEYIVGLGEALYLDEAFGAASTVFDSVLQSGDLLANGARDRVLDWWADSSSTRAGRGRKWIGAASTSESGRGWKKSSSRGRRARRRPTGWPRPPAGRATFRVRGMRRRRHGCARRWRSTRVCRCARSSIG